MGTPIDKAFNLVLNELKRRGLLLESDTRLPNVCRIVTGETMKGSWWSHPQAHTIFAVNELLADHSDVLLTKLISGKVTFVHRKLWRPVYSVAVSREEWQIKTLSGSGRLLLKKVDREGSLLTNKLAASFGVKTGDAARELENRLLIHATQIHTTSGAHAKILETWETWAKRVGYRPRPTTATVARSTIEQKVNKLNKEFNGKGRLPWG